MQHEDDDEEQYQEGSCMSESNFVYKGAISPEPAWDERFEIGLECRIIVTGDTLLHSVLNQMWALGHTFPARSAKHKAYVQSCFSLSKMGNTLTHEELEIPAWQMRKERRFGSLPSMKWPMFSSKTKSRVPSVSNA